MMFANDDYTMNFQNLGVNVGKKVILLDNALNTKKIILKLLA